MSASIWGITFRRIEDGGALEELGELIDRFTAIEEPVFTITGDDIERMKEEMSEELTRFLRANLDENGEFTFSISW